MIWWYVAAVFVAILLASTLGPKPQSRPPAGLGDIKAPTAEEGREITVLFGTRLLEGPNVVWYGDFETIPVKKKA